MRVSRWGNSLAIRLPKAAVVSLEVREGEPADLAIEGDRVVLRAPRPRYTLEELVAAMRPEDEPAILDDVGVRRWARSCCEPARARCAGLGQLHAADRT